MTNELLKTLTQQYVTHFPAEQDQLRALMDQLAQPQNNIFSSQEFRNGHTTAAAFVVEAGTRRVLLLKHNGKHQFMQPGGHTEPEDVSLRGAALRETSEETGLSEPALHYQPLVPGEPEVPLNIAVYSMPAKLHKQEPGHYHYDFQYLFTVQPGASITIDPNESEEFRWFAWEEFAAIAEYQHTAVKIQSLLS